MRVRVCKMRGVRKRERQIYPNQPTDQPQAEERANRKAAIKEAMRALEASSPSAPAATEVGLKSWFYPRHVRVASCTGRTGIFRSGGASKEAVCASC